MERIKENLFTQTGWELIETGYNKSQSINSGSNFMIGNGYLGYRGTLAEDTREDYTGCFVTDTWDKADGKWEELCNVPNALFTRIYINDVPLSVKNNPTKEFRRMLNFNNGISSIEYSQILEKSKFVRYSEEKFASLSNIHLIPMKIEILISEDSSIKIVDSIDSQVWNLNGEHLKNHKSGHTDNLLHITCDTFQKGQEIAVGLKTRISGLFNKNEQIIETEGKILREIHGEAKKGERVIIHKYMCVYHSNDCSQPLSKCLKDLAQAHYDDLAQLNKDLWSDKWDKYDIKIKGNLLDELAIRFNTYHSVIATPTHKSLPIGARGLSCQAYQGAAFWDQEIFNLPMYLYTDKQIAKNILMYRYETLDGARRKAKRLGYEGAYYAWISGKTGDELCPDFFFKDVITGRPIRNHFNDWQIHISMDIAYSFWKYHEIFHDYEFLFDYGAEVIFECARFVSSHTVYKPRKSRYEFVKLQGPDEYHENVENNAFTNYQAKHNLDITLKLIKMFKEKEADKFNNLVKKIDLKNWEIDLFEDINEKIYLPQPNDELLLEQFDGYFDLESIVPADKIKSRLIKADEYYGWPNGIALFTQAIKQADVIQLMVMHPECFSTETIEANYNYYEPRTLHFSSLSPSVYAIAAARINLIQDALKNFRKSAFIDLKNSNDPISGGTFIGGIHTAAAGAAWQIAANGFAGLSLKDGVVYLNPHLPKEWESICFKLLLDENSYEIEISHHETRVHYKKKTELFNEFSIYDKTHSLKDGLNEFHVIGTAQSD